MSIYNVHRKGVMAGYLTPLLERSTVTFKGIKVFSRGLLVVTQPFRDEQAFYYFNCMMK
jgi:hypothetical protein